MLKLKATTALKLALAQVDFPNFKKNHAKHDTYGRQVIFSEKRKSGNFAIKFVGYYPKLSKNELNNALNELGYELVDITVTNFNYGSISYPTFYNGTRFTLKEIDFIYGCKRNSLR